MKNFVLYSKNPLTSRMNEGAFSQIKFFKKGLRWFYILGLFSPIFLFLKKQYKLGFIMLALFLFLTFLPNFMGDFLPQIYFFSVSLQVLLVIFGDDIEEAFLKKSGYKPIGVIAEKNASKAQEKLGSMLDIAFSNEAKSNFPSCLLAKLRPLAKLREKKLAK